MKETKQVLTILFLAVLLVSVLCVPAFAITESEVQAKVAASSKGAVAGNVLIWFLCAVAFLKVSQKIDSFMATLGVNVGRTGGSMLAEAMVAMRAVTMVVGGGRGAGAGRTAPAGSGTAGKSGASGMTGFFKGGLVGMAGRHITNSAVKTATTQTSAVHTAQNQVHKTAATAAAQTAPDTHINSEVHTSGSTIYTENSTPTVSPVPSGMPPQEGVIFTGNEPPPSVPQSDSIHQPIGEPSEGAPPEMSPPQEGVILTDGENTVHAPQTENIFSGGTEGTVHKAVTGGERRTEAHTERTSQVTHTSSSGSTSGRVQTNRFHAGTGARPTLGGMVFSRSLAAGGSFANDVIGTVARGEVAGSITGDMAAQSLVSYMGQADTGIGSRETPIYSDVEIGRGRITGVETAAGTSEGLSFAMYHVDQYAAPTGEYTKVVSADGTQWYKQYAQTEVERKPYMAPDDTVAYHERIIKKLPDPPRRKDRV